MQVIDQLSDEQKLAEIKAGKLRIRLAVAQRIT